MKALLFVAASAFALTMTLCAGPAAASTSQTDIASKSVSTRTSGSFDVAIMKRDEATKRSGQTKRARK